MNAHIKHIKVVYQRKCESKTGVFDIVRRNRRDQA